MEILNGSIGLGDSSSRSIDYGWLRPEVWYLDTQGWPVMLLVGTTLPDRTLFNDILIADPQSAIFVKGSGP